MAEYRVPTTNKVLQFFDLKGLLGKVKDITDVPPDSPVKGDRYIVGDNASGDWAGHAKDIAEYDGSVWKFKTPNSGDFVYVENISNYRFFVDNNWHSIDYLSDIQEELADDGLFFKKRRYGFNTSVLNSVINVETQETDVDLIEIRRHIVNSESLRDVTEVLDVNDVSPFDATDIVIDSDLNAYYVTSNNVLFKVNRNGEFLLAKSFSNLSNALRLIKMDSEGYIYVATSQNPVQIIKLDSDFNIVWQNLYDFGGTVYSRSMVIDDKIYLNAVYGAYCFIASINLDGTVDSAVKFTVDSVTSWYEYDYNEMTLSLTKDYLFVASYPYYPDVSTYVGTVVKINKADLSILWAKRYGNKYLPFSSIVYDEAENCYIMNTNPRNNSGSYDGGIVRIDEDGNLIDYKRFTNFDTEYMATDVAIVEDGYILVGSSSAKGVIKVDKNLNLVKYYANPNRDCRIVIARDNRVFLPALDGYLAVLDKDLTLLSQDSEWTDKTATLEESTYNFVLTDQTFSQEAITVSISSCSGTIESVSYSFNVIAERTYDNNSELLEKLFVVDKDGNAKFNGGIKVSSSLIEEEGTIVYKDVDLKGYINGQWKSLTKQGKYIPETDEVEFDVE